MTWEAFSGARLRDTRSMRGLDRVVRTAPPSLRAVAPSVPPALEAALAPLPSRGAVGEWPRECFVTERDALQRRIRAHADTARGPRSRS